VNYVNAPVLLQRLGVQVEIVKSSNESDYTELIQIEAQAADGSIHSAAGTLIGKSHQPRVVSINGRDVEIGLSGVLLLIENSDEPGMVGMVGTILGKHRVNIASMALGRIEAGGTAITALNLDSAPGADALRELQAPASIKRAMLVQL
jgi:D-3-phosphoglycerate dehydrogenase